MACEEFGFLPLASRRNMRSYIDQTSIRTEHGDKSAYGAPFKKSRVSHIAATGFLYRTRNPEYPICPMRQLGAADIGMVWLLVRSGFDAQELGAHSSRTLPDTEKDGSV